MPVVISGLTAAMPLFAAVSPLAEFGSALHVWQDPGHHDRADWAPPISAGLLSRTERWAWTVQKHRSSPFVTVPAPAETFHEQLVRLQAMPARELAAGLLRPLRRVSEAGMRFGPARSPAVAELIDRLHHDPDEPVADFLDFLKCSWDEWFADEWARIQPVLAARARHFAQLVAASGAPAALAALDPALTAGADRVTLAEVCHNRHDVSGRGLVVLPSTFTWPHVWVVDVPDQPLVLIHAAGTAPAAAPSLPLVLARLEAMAHPQRFRVAQTILSEALTAGEVAELVHADPTLVNRHLRVLARAGLARTSRRGRFVRYRLDGDALAGLGGEVLSMLHK
jgi:DNA-binding transcriptional ArsR family regulator